MAKENRNFELRMRSMSRPGFLPLSETFMEEQYKSIDNKLMISAIPLLFPYHYIIEAKVQALIELSSSVYIINII